MMQINIQGANAGYLAAEWCEKNLVWDNWDMWLQNAWGDYLFEFKNDKDATLFSLVWAQYALI